VLGKLEEELKARAEEAEKSGTYILDEELVKKIETQLKVELPQVDLKPKSVLEEVIPPFFESRFVVTGFSNKKKGKTAILSPAIKHEGV
jgi:hypothetical protein